MNGVASPLMVSLDCAIGSDCPTLISIEGHGSISVYPRHRTYTTDIPDWGSLPFLGNAPIKTSPCVWGIPSEGGMPVCELRWLAAYHHASQALGAQPAPRGLVKLVHWPDLSGVPDELAAPIVRICALLWRKSTASTLMPRVLGAEPGQTDVLLRVLQGFGHVEIATGFATRVEGEGEGEGGVAAPLATGDERAGSAAGAVIAKLWQRLLGR